MATFGTRSRVDERRFSRGQSVREQSKSAVVNSLTSASSKRSYDLPVPAWVKQSVESWSLAAGINAGRLLRSINKAGRIWGDGFRDAVNDHIGVEPDTPS